MRSVVFILNEDAVKTRRPEHGKIAQCMRTQWVDARRLRIVGQRRQMAEADDRLGLEKAFAKPAQFVLTDRPVRLHR